MESLSSIAGIHTTLYINYASIKIIKVHFEKEKAHKLIDIS